MLSRNTARLQSLIVSVANVRDEFREPRLYRFAISFNHSWFSRTIFFRPFRAFAKSSFPEGRVADAPGAGFRAPFARLFLSPVTFGMTLVPLDPRRKQV